jgi:hypothetical protein
MARVFGSFGLFRLWGALTLCACSAGAGPGEGAGGTDETRGRSGGARSDGSSGGAVGSGVGGALSSGGSVGAGGAPGSGGAAGAADAAAMAPRDAAATDVATPTPPAGPPKNPATCSEMGAGPTPPAGFMKADPMDPKLPFSTHFMGIFSDNPSCIGMTSLSDIDNDGDEDFASGQRDVACSGRSNPGAPVLWWEYCAPDRWVRHTVGTGYKSAAGGGAGDFDGDGWIDLVGGDSWFKNPGAGVRGTASWQRLATGAPGVTEEIRVGDLTGDGKFEVLYVERSFRPHWRTPGSNATAMWTVGATLAYSQQQGDSIGDLDGDGKNDILVGDRWWYRNDGGGEGAGKWPAVPIPPAPSFSTAAAAAGSSPITALADVDGDGDLDILLQEHWGTKVGWLENADAKATIWTPHMIVGAGGPFAAKSRSLLHGLMPFDFDNDGDIDVLSTENQGQIWIYENTDGKGSFAEHVVALGGAHEPRVADVDCDGDLDFVGVPWGDLGDGAAGRSETIRAHVYFKNELVERGGPALFDRPKAEVWNVPNQGRCK